MRKNNYSNHKLLPFDTIKAATQGDADAMNTVTKHFSGYIAKLSVRPMRDEYGNERYVVDENIRCQLEAKLAAAVLKFKVA
jgi:hypothetical protein